MKELIDEIVKMINQTNRIVNIRISGHGASGKTTFTNQLINYLEDGTYNLLETDAYIIDSEIRNLASIGYEFKGQNYKEKITGCTPLAHELNSLKRDVLALSMGVDIMTIDEPWAPSIRLLGNRRINIIEGLSAYFLENDLFDISIIFKCDDETEILRRLDRDVDVRGVNPDYIKTTQSIRRRQYEHFMMPLESEFDFVIDTSKNKFIKVEYL